MKDHPFFYFLKEGKIFFDENSLFIIAFNEGSVFIPVRAFNKLQLELISSIGLEKTKEIIKKIAYFQVDQSFKRYCKIYEIDNLPIEKLFEFIKLIGGFMGFGNASLYKIDDNEFLAKFIPSTIFSFEARKEYGNLDFSFDIYLSYIIEKIFSLIYGKEFKCEEVECYAKGDEKCVFKVKSTL